MSVLRSNGIGDMVARDGSGNLWYYQGSGNPSPPYKPRVKAGSGWSGYTMTGVGDMTGDGKPDLVARASSGNLFENPAFHNRVRLVSSAAQAYVPQLPALLVSVLRVLTMAVTLSAVLVTTTWWLIPLLAVAAIPVIRVSLWRHRPAATGHPKTHRCVVTRIGTPKRRAAQPIVPPCTKTEKATSMKMIS
jgi:hypothetical protein